MAPDACAICLEDLDFHCTRNMVLRLACKHAFHYPCIKAWFRKKWVCPLCQTGVQTIPRPRRLRAIIKARKKGQTGDEFAVSRQICCGDHEDAPSESDSVNHCRAASYCFAPLVCLFLGIFILKAACE